MTKSYYFLFFNIAIHLLYFSLAIFIGGIYTLDSNEYIHSAFNLYHHNSSYCGLWSENLSPELLTLRPPGYPLFLMFFQVINSNIFFPLFVQNVASVWLIHSLYKSFFQNNAILLTLLLVAFPVYFISVNMIMADFLLGFTLYIVVMWAMKYFESTDIKYYIFCILLLATTPFIKPVMMFFWVPLGIFILWMSYRRKNYFNMGWFFIMPLLILLWSYRNLNETGYFHFSSIKMQNLLEINAGSILSQKYSHEFMMAHRKTILTKAFQIEDFKQRSIYRLQVAKDTLEANKWRYVVAHSKGMLNFVLAPGKIDMEIFFDAQEKSPVSLLYLIEKYGIIKGLKDYTEHNGLYWSLLILFIFIFNIVGIVLTGFGILSKKLSIETKVFILMIIGYVIFASGPGGYARFKVSLFPLMLIMMSFGIEEIKALNYFGFKKLIRA